MYIHGNKGKHHSEEHKRKISESGRRIGRKHTQEFKDRMIFLNTGKKHSEESRKKMSLVHMGMYVGEKSPRWIKDRTKLSRTSKQGERRTAAYFEWRKQTRKRDNWKCKISNQDCAGRIEAHHILPWKDYPELRYDVNNGITLCHAHHPRKRAEEVMLAPVFQGLVTQIAN